MTAGPSEGARPAGGVGRAVMAALAVLGASVMLAAVATTAHAQEDDARSFDTEVNTRGVTDLCVAGETEECSDVGQNVDGVLEVVMAGASDDGQADIESCPDGRTGVVIALSNLGSDATVTAALTGEAEQNGEAEETDERVGPVDTISAGQATVTLCGSAEGDEEPSEFGDPVDPGEPNPGEPDPGEPGPGGLLDLVQGVLESLGLGDPFDPGDLPADSGELPEDPTEDLPQDPTEELPEDPTEQLPQDLPEELPVDPGDGLPDEPGDGVPEDPGDGVPEDPRDGVPDDPREDAPESPDDTPDGGDSSGEAGAEADGGVNADSDGNADAGGNTQANGGMQDERDSGSSEDSDDAHGIGFDSDDVLGG